MRLLFFINTLKGGGAERVLANLGNELVRRGHEIIISLNENATNYELDPRVLIHSSRICVENKGRTIAHQLLHRINKSFLGFRHTKRVIKQEKPDCIITFLQCNMLPIICSHGNIPIVHSEHNAYDRKLGMRYHFNRFFLNRFFDKVFVLSPFDQGFARAKGLSNTAIMPNPNTFLPISDAEYVDFFSKRRNILACGRISSWYVKGFDIAIKAFAEVSKLVPGVDLDIAGAGDKESIDTLMQIAAKYNVENRVHFLGRCSNIQEVMRQHQLFLLASRTEGFPMVVTEAMSQGLPCVAFEHLASFIILNKIDGYLVNDEDVLALSKAMQDLLLSDELRFRFGKAGLCNVNRFAADVIATKWEDQLSRL